METNEKVTSGHCGPVPCFLSICPGQNECQTNYRLVPSGNKMASESISGNKQSIFSKVSGLESAVLTNSVFWTPFLLARRQGSDPGSNCGRYQGETQSFGTMTRSQDKVGVRGLSFLPWSHAEIEEVDNPASM